MQVVQNIHTLQNINTLTEQCILVLPLVQKSEGGIGVALCGWLLDASGFVKEATIQPESCLNMLHVMYLWIPMVLSLIITFIMSRMNVEDANKKLRKQLEEC